MCPSLVTVALNLKEMARAMLMSYIDLTPFGNIIVGPIGAIASNYSELRNALQSRG